MSETPPTNAASSPNIFELFGMPVHIDRALPESFFALIPIERIKAEPGSSDLYSIAQHSVAVSNLASFEWTDEDLISAFPHLQDELAAARLRAFENAFYGYPISTNNIEPEPIEPKSAVEILDEIERLIREDSERKLQQNMELIDTFLEAGFKVAIDDTDLPMMTLPESYREAYRAVMSERLREQHGIWGQA